MKNKYKVLLFDMDGTTANTDRVILETFYIMYDKYKNGKRRPDDEIMYFSGPPLVEALPLEFPGHTGVELRDDFYDLSFPLYEKFLTAYPNEKEVLLKLKEKGYKMSIVTNKGHDMAVYVLKLLGLTDLFDYVVGVGDVSKNKPDPEGVELVLSKYGVDKKDALYIGDNDVDYFTAENSDIDSMIVTWGPRKISILDKATYQVNSYDEILEIL
jgi:pyrophosphatase PpaX